MARKDWKPLRQIEPMADAWLSLSKVRHLQRGNKEATTTDVWRVEVGNVGHKDKFNKDNAMSE
jgi:hypothetical protein